MSQKDIPAEKFLNPDDVDVSTLNCDEFVEWLNAKKFSPEHCKAFRGTYIRISINHYGNLTISIATYVHSYRVLISYIC